MLIISNISVMNFENAIRGARNPMNSWDKFDSYYEKEGFVLGVNDLSLVNRLSSAGSDHRKFLRQIFISLDINAPLYWWKEFDTYKVGTVANSTSTMHRIHSQAFRIDQFSCDKMSPQTKAKMIELIGYLEELRNNYNNTGDKQAWLDIIQLLPSSYNQLRTCTMNYEVASSIYHARKNHKLDEWHTFCDCIETLPYATEMITKERKNLLEFTGENVMNTKSTLRTVAPFRYDIVGSFLRPEPLKKARSDFAAGEISAAVLTQVEDQCIRELVSKEIAAGLKSVTDGEFRRSYWHLDFMWGFQGIEHVRMKSGYIFHSEETRADSARVCGIIHFESHPFIAHYRYLKSIAGDDVLTRQTIPAPAQFYAELVRAENEEALNQVYPDRDILFLDLCNAYRGFILALYDEGCRNLQLDDCTWGMLCDTQFRTMTENHHIDIGGLKKLYISLNNEAIAGLPKDMIVNTHVCRGNYHSDWAVSGGYASVADELFVNENVNAYYLEFDDDRSGGFEPLLKVSGNKLVVLGLVTSKHPTLEDKEMIIKRIREASAYIALDRLSLSPQCGFASTEEGNLLTEEDQWYKVRLVKEIAEEVWGNV
jgi:methionine synthase II (cobalamin-independent)